MENVSPNKRVEDIYQKKTQLEHILLRPDTYIGSVEPETETLWVFDDAAQRMVEKKVTFVPGLFKIFDEILVNASDNKQRDPTMNALEVDVDVAAGSISVYNNGKGIPIQMHKEHECYVPELIFGHLLTSSNYNDKEAKTTGGRNGYGAKLANIFSTEFIVETQDTKVGQVYKQVFSNNMGSKGKPQIKDMKKPGDWTRITFKPDFPKFGMKGFDADILALIKKRVMDIAGTTAKGLKVKFNGEMLKANDFKTYMDLYFTEGSPEAQSKVYAKVNDRWEVCVCMSDGNFKQVSFVNNIWTMKGGRHVTYVTDQAADALVAHINKKNKGLNIKPSQVKNHMFVFVNALITNPAFDSQTKVNLTSKQKDFGSKCELDEKFIKNLIKSGLVENVLAFAKFKQNKDLKKNDGKKKTRLTGIPKLDDANEAGGKRASECTLILTEGDSAKALAVSGLSVVGRDLYGVFPLKGKLLNVREANHKAIMANQEITYLKQIMGLKQGENYTDTKSLRYGHVMIMTDQDHDGSHIKGLLINMFATFWPSLLKLPGFLTEFITPIVRVSKGKQAADFYTLPEYENWRAANNEGKGWKIKYYKGLGTSTAQEAKQYFSDLVRHKIDFAHSDDAARDGQLIDMAFSKKKADARKEWIMGYKEGDFLDQNVATINYTDFINKELILFSIASNVRAIPHVMDGLKPGQRKILFSCFKRKLTKEIKVAQLAGYVSEHSAYHHGEMSLTSTIVCLAQNFVGSNNINLLVPSGQFGTRLQGGKDAASSRYIFTYLSPIAHALFKAADEPVLNWLNDDGLPIEPDYYLPVVPMVLVNGSAGIGTGWSSSVPTYNPRDIVSNLRALLRGQSMEPMHPWFNGFTGEVLAKTDKNGNVSYVIKGRVEKIGEVNYAITELPVGTWTADFKLLLEPLIEKGVLKDVREYHTDSTVRFEVAFASLEHATAAETMGLRKYFKLTSTLQTTNMVLFDTNGKLHKYDSVHQIMEDFYRVRLAGYEARKKHMVHTLTQELTKLSNKARFILAVVEDKVKLRNVSKDKILQQLAKEGYAAFPKGKGKKAAAEEEEGEDSGEEEGEEAEAKTGGLASDYDYLLSMPLWSLTMEKVKALTELRDEKEAELNRLLATSPKQLWEGDLDELMVALEQHEEIANRAAAGDAKLCGKGGNKKGGKAKKKAESDDDNDSDWDDEKPKKKKKPAAKKEAKVTGPVTWNPPPPSPEDKIAPVRVKKELSPEEKAAKAARKAEKLAKAANRKDGDKKPKKKADKWDSDAESEEESEIDVSDVDDEAFEAPVPAREKTARRAAAAKVNYAGLDGEGSEDEENDGGEEEDDASDFEQDNESDYEAKPKKKAAPKVKAEKVESAPKAKAEKAPKAKAAPKAKTDKVAPKAKPTSPKKASDDEEREPVSLVDRLAARMGNSMALSVSDTPIKGAGSASPSPSPASSGAGKGGKAKAAAKKPAVKRTNATKKATEPAGFTSPNSLTPAPKRQRKESKETKVKAVATLGAFAFTEEDAEEKKPVKAKAAPKAKTDKPKAAPKAKAPAVKKAAPKKKKGSDDEDDEEDYKPAATAAAPARATRERKVVNYAGLDAGSEDDEEEEESEEEEEEAASDYAPSP